MLSEWGYPFSYSPSVPGERRERKERNRKTKGKEKRNMKYLLIATTLFICHRPWEGVITICPTLVSRRKDVAARMGDLTVGEGWVLVRCSWGVGGGMEGFWVW